MRNWAIAFIASHSLVIGVAVWRGQAYEAQLAENRKTIAEKDEALLQSRCNLAATKKMLSNESGLAPNVLEMYERARAQRCRNHEGDMQ